MATDVSNDGTVTVSDKHTRTILVTDATGTVQHHLGVDLRARIDMLPDAGRKEEEQEVPKGYCLVRQEADN